MTDLLDRKIQKIYADLGQVVSSPFTTANVKPRITQTEKGFRIEMDFNQGISEIELENSATLFITNIASIKDHFKIWCKNNHVPFKGDELINNNLAVAIIRNLWNIDKHTKLSKQPHARFFPSLRGLGRGISFTGASIS